MKRNRSRSYFGLSLWWLGVINQICVDILTVAIHQGLDTTVDILLIWIFTQERELFGGLLKTGVQNTCRTSPARMSAKDTHKRAYPHAGARPHAQE